MSSDQPKNHLRAWREFREMTQEQLGERIGTTKAVISAIERGERGLSSKWLMKLAPALDTEPGHLLKHDPAAVPMDILDVWRNVPDDRKPEALEMLQIFNKKRA